MILEIKRKNKLFEVLIDTEDYDLVKGYTWNIIKDGKTYYVHAHSHYENGKQKKIRMHRLIMSAPEGVPIDHIFHNGLDNRKENLRLITSSGNNRNRIVENKTGFMGVSETKYGKFVARIYINHKKKHLGTFDTPEQAHEVYMKEYHKQIEKEIM